MKKKIVLPVVGGILVVGFFLGVNVVKAQSASTNYHSSHSRLQHAAGLDVSWHNKPFAGHSGKRHDTNKLGWHRVQ